MVGQKKIFIKIIYQDDWAEIFPNKNALLLFPPQKYCKDQFHSK